MATLFKRNDSYGYTMMEKETPEEKHHREAQFMIYKTLKQADQITMVRRSSKGKPSWLKLRICKLKVRIGKRLLRLRKTMLSNMVRTKMGVYKHVMCHLKNFKRLFSVTSGGGGRLGGGCGGGAASVGHLPHPLFTTS